MLICNRKSVSVKLFTSVAPFLLSAIGVASYAQTTPTGTQPDNTKVNQRDRSAAEPTADNQKENESDRKLSADVRKAIVGDKSLSSDAHNIKVISQNGSVTLKGPVKSEDEKKTVLA